MKNNHIRMHSTRILLAALVLGVFLVTGPLVNAAYNVPFFVKASTDEGGGSDESGNEDNNDSGSDGGEGGDSGDGGGDEPEPTPEHLNLFRSHL
jgi:hypothetical protein